MKQFTEELKFSEDISVTLKRRKNSKRVIFRMAKSDELIITAPTRLSAALIRQSLQENSAWIEHQHIRLRREERLSDEIHNHRTLEQNGLPQSIFLNAIEQTINVIYRPTTAAHCRALLHDETLVVSGAIKDQAKVLLALKRWLGRYAEEIFLPWLHDLAMQTSQDFMSLTCNMPKTRFGSCTEKGRIRLNARLLFYPADFVDYVMIHELCHRKHMNHSAAFWQLVAYHCPEYKQYTNRKQQKLWARSEPPWLQ